MKITPTFGRICVKISKANDIVIDGKSHCGIASFTQNYFNIDCHITCATSEVTKVSACVAKWYSRLSISEFATKIVSCLHLMFNFWELRFILLLKTSIIRTFVLLMSKVLYIFLIGIWQLPSHRYIFQKWIKKSCRRWRSSLC